MDNSYNQRQLHFMLKIIDGYIDEKSSLNKLTSDLEALYNLMQLNDQDWNNRFRSEWWELEQINAFQLDAKIVDSKDDVDINIALDNLKKIINEKVMDGHAEKHQLGLREPDNDNRQKI